MRAPRTANVRSMVNSLRVRELQIVLAELNLARSGRKQELIDRIVHALEQFEAKATENASNHATAAFYNDQLEAALRCLQTQVNATRAGSGGAAASSAGMSAPPPPQPPSASSGYARPPPPVVYGRPIPFNGHARAPSTHHHLVPPAPMAATAQSNATEVLHATTPAALNGARCFCGSSGAASGKVVACVECGLRVHAKCHQLVNAPASEKNDWYCEVCRAELCDPFLRVKKTVRAPVFVKFNRNQALQRIEYTITDQDLNDLYSNQDRAAPGSMTPGKLELQLRCFILKEELGTGTSWPTTSVIAANGFGLQLVQRAPPGQSNPSKVLREQPSNLFPYSRVGRNMIEVRTGENPVVFCFMVQIVEFRNVADIVNEVRAASESITYEDAKKDVIKSFGGDDDDDDDDAVVATSTVLSLRCPLGLCMIDLPARGLHCKHLQCFDLKTFLMFNKKARSRHYRCTVCHNFIKASDLRIDPYLKKLLREVQGDEDLEEVEILPDATWKRRAGDEAEAAPPPKRVKTELGDLSITPAATTTAAPSTAATATTGAGDAGPGSANAPFEIDLSLSSDEEDDGLSVIPTLTATTGTPSTASATTSTANLSDDDIPIFTVDSDVWELPPGNVNASGNDMPFPMDIFSTFGTANGGNHVDLSTGNGNWTTSAAASYSAMPSLTATSTTSSAYASSTPAWAASSSSNSSTATAAGSARGSEVGLANAMAQLSRNHPHVSNPFDARRSPAAPKPAASAGGSGGGGSSALDVICLLDSDSD